MARGGPRDPTPGQAYDNRSDLNQPARTGPSREYGDRKQRMEQQQLAPIPTQAGVGQPVGEPQVASETQPGGGQTPAPTQPGGVPPGRGLTDPSERPGEMVNAGLGGPPQQDPEMLALRDLNLHLRAMYGNYPTREVLWMIEDVENKMKERGLI